MFTKTTQQQKEAAPIQAPALNSTIWGGLASAVAAVGAATVGSFSAMNTTEWQVRVAIVAGVTLVIAVGLVVLVALIRNDSQIRSATAASTSMAITSKTRKTASQIAWITPPSMHVYSTTDPETALQVILVGMDKDEVYYLASAPKGRPETLKSEQVAKVELGEHHFH
jgi:hypothetical protein